MIKFISANIAYHRNSSSRECANCRVNNDKSVLKAISFFAMSLPKSHVCSMRLQLGVECVTVWRLGVFRRLGVVSRLRQSVSKFQRLHFIELSVSTILGLDVVVATDT
jgi:hypothetical protein